MTIKNKKKHFYTDKTDCMYHLYNIYIFDIYIIKFVSAFDK
jgi:hypothetical protein